METFSLATFGMILEATGQKDDWSLSKAETEKFREHYSEILIDISKTPTKEIEAYLCLETCHTYEQLAKLIAKREHKNMSDEEFENLLSILRTRAHRGRRKVLKKISQIYRIGK